MHPRFGLNGLHRQGANAVSYTHLDVYKRQIDDDANQTGQMLATLWGRPQATFASKLTIADGKATVVREVDAGLETLEVDLPAVVTTCLLYTSRCV